MHIVNAMFSRGLGGIEQCFLDYCRALEQQGNRVTAIIHPDAAVRASLNDVEAVACTNRGQWDMLAKYRLRCLLKKLKPDVVIVHGNRAVSLLKPAARGICPVVGVTHNYSLQHLVKLDAVLALTDDLQKKLLELGYPKERIFRVPNMVNCHPERSEGSQAGDSSASPQNDSPCIAALGRFVHKKGFDVLIEALGELQKQGKDFRAVIGGDGEEKSKLEQQVKIKGLSDKITFSGWVEDKDSFFRQADIFVLPSRHEPFGIVLLEAMARGLPIVTTDSEGPSEIVTQEKDALLVPRDDPKALAAAIARLMDDAALCGKLAAGGLATMREHYDINVVGARIEDCLKKILRHRPTSHSEV